jgi:hypothetical protein
MKKSKVHKEPARPDVPPRGPKLTAAQNYAIERIRFFKKELSKYGVEPVTGTELECFPEDQNGELVQTLLFDQQKIDAAFKDYPYFKKFEVPVLEQLYEVALGEGDPELIAKATAGLKEHEGLRTLVAERHKPGECRLNFSARPKYRWWSEPEKVWVDSPYTAGLHINVSLKNKDGIPLFGGLFGKNALLKNCTRGVMAVQKEGMLLFAPQEDSYYRFTSTPTSSPGNIPEIIGCGFHKRDGGSVMLRGYYVEDGYSVFDNNIRIENRLAGADADPYVAMAATLAGIYLGVLATKDKAKLQEIYGRGDLKNVAWGGKGPDDMVPTNINKAKARFEGSTLMRNVLGNKLFEAVRSGNTKPAPGVVEMV